MEHARYGIFQEISSIVGLTVAEVRQRYTSAWSIPSDASAFCGTVGLKESDRIPAGAIIEFHRRPESAPLMVRCAECRRAVDVAAPKTHIFVASDPLLYYCEPCWLHIHSPRGHDLAVAELIEVLAS